jgi:hypothetical protein
MELRHRTLFAAATHVSNLGVGHVCALPRASANLFAYASLEEALATLATDGTIMLAARFVAAHDAQFDAYFAHRGCARIGEQRICTASTAAAVFRRCGRWRRICIRRLHTMLNARVLCVQTWFADVVAGELVVVNCDFISPSCGFSCAFAMYCRYCASRVSVLRSSGDVPVGVVRWLAA